MKKIKIGDEDYTKKFLQLKNPPKAIWVKGDISLLEKPALAIVGSRKNTPYGEKIAKLFATQIAKQGIVIVSGLALGIDTIAHTYSKRKHDCSSWLWTKSNISRRKQKTCKRNYRWWRMLIIRI